MDKKPRLSNMPGVVRWLLDLEYFGPQRRPVGRSGASARMYGLTDFWVQHKTAKRWMFLETLKEKEKANPHWYELVNYDRGHEAITPRGRAALHEHLETYEGKQQLREWKQIRARELRRLSRKK